MKKLFIVLLLLLSLCGCKEKGLPLPEVEEGMRGQLGIDKNINETTIDQYLNRDDTVYFDMRMLKDEAKFENIGGDSYLSGFIDGFEVLPYPFLCNVEGLPEEVGQSYSGTTLYSLKDGIYTPNYKESLDILKHYFPKDKNIFLMCGGGGYAGMSKNMLVALGWDANKIYDVGGYWYYEGSHKVEVKRIEDGETYYDFYKVNYHEIDFNELHYIGEDKPDEEDEDVVIHNDFLTEITNIDELNSLVNEKETFILYVYMPGCMSCANFKPVVEEFVDSNQVLMYGLSYQLAKESDNIVKENLDYTPSIMIFVEGELKAFLDAGSDEDLPYYQNVENLSTWINNYIDIDIIKGSYTNDVEPCQDACKLEN